MGTYTGCHVSQPHWKSFCHFQVMGSSGLCGIAIDRAHFVMQAKIRAARAQVRLRYD